jgi:hypothetical protein
MTNTNITIEDMEDREYKFDLLTEIDEYISNECEDRRSMLKSASFMFSKNFSYFEDLSIEELEEFIKTYCVN